MDGNIILIVTYFKKTYITQPPAAGTLCWDEFLQLTIVLSVCIGFIQTGAFLFTENYLGHGQKFLVTPRGKCAFYLLSRKGAQLPPPLSHSPPKIHLPAGKKISMPTECTLPAPAMQTSMPKWKSSPFPAGDFLEQPNQKEEQNDDQIQKQ